MSDETIAVVALDAADYALCQSWGCGNILLDNHHELETFAYSGEKPITLEVWTSVATGVHPQEHGMASTGEQQSWDNPLLEIASRLTPYLLPKDVRVKLGTMIQGDNDSVRTFTPTGHDHMFPNGGAYQWPGVTYGKHLAETWHWLELAEQGDIADAELWRRLYANAGKELGWIMGMSHANLSIIGAHSHILDAAGHAFANRPERLREIYLEVDELLGAVRDKVDRLVVLSDHGMEIGWIDGDENPGAHSWRAVFSTTEEGSLPETVFDVREWVEERASTSSMSSEASGLDTTREQLKDLGYI